MFAVHITPNSHRPPDTTTRLCRVRQCPLSLETVAWSLIKKFRFSHMQQSTACLHFAWRTTSLRVGGRAARRSCLRGLRASRRRRSTGRHDSLVVSGVAV